MERKIIQKEEKGQVLVYPAQYYYLELNTARMLRELDIDCPEDEKRVERRISQIQKETGTVLDEMQEKAVKEAAGHGLLVLTGGPVQVRRQLSMQSSASLKVKVQSFGWQHLPAELRSV